MIMVRIRVHINRTKGIKNICDWQRSISRFRHRYYRFYSVKSQFKAQCYKFIANNSIAS